MAGFGSPCGACKFLRRKCVSGCVFAPHFCHEKAAAHFAAIHKVFGASNASKLLMHLPAADRSEAALTISYEARARLIDPIYGCVAHIFALQRQVFVLQAQLASLKAQAQGLGINDGSKLCSKFPAYYYEQDGQAFFPSVDRSAPPSFTSSPSMNAESLDRYSSCLQSSQQHISHCDMADECMFSMINDQDDASCSMASMQASHWRSACPDVKRLQ